MEAFAKDSANNVIGGSGPVNSNIDLAQFHGRGTEGFNDYSTSAAVVNAPAPPSSYVGSSALHRGGRKAMRPEAVDRQSSFNATENLQPIYGQETMGLGQSTFLEGTPAAKSAIQRRESESDSNFSSDPNGLGRKRSLAQRIRGISNAGHRDRAYRPPIGSNNRVISPDNNNGLERTTSRPGLASGDSQSAGGMPRIHESKPFFQDYDKEEQQQQQRKGITIAEDKNRRDSFGEGEDAITVRGKDVAQEGGAIPEVRARAFSSPKRGQLERRVTHDGMAAGAGSGEKEGGGGGFLSRVKSLKGWKKGRAGGKE